MNGMGPDPYKWQPWFAWYPVNLSVGMAWLQWVEYRTADYIVGDGTGQGDYRITYTVYRRPQ